MKRGTRGAWSAKFDCIEQFIGGNVGRMRRERGLTQEQLADAIGVAVKSLQDIEYGTCNCTARVLAALADVFECSPGDFFTYAEVPPRKRGRPQRI